MGSTQGASGDGVDEDDEDFMDFLRDSPRKKNTVKNKNPGAEEDKGIIKSAMAETPLSGPRFTAPNRSWQKKVSLFWSKYQPSMSYCPIHPTSLFSKIWNSIMEFSFGIVIITLPLPLCYPTWNYILPGLSIFIFVMSIIDLMIKLQTGVALALEVEMEPKKIVALYARNGTFLFDFVTGVPWVLLIDALTEPDTNARYFLRLICLVHGFPFIRLLFSSKLSYSSEILTDYIQRYDVNVAAVQAGKIVVLMNLYWYFLYNIRHWHASAIGFLQYTKTIPYYDNGFSNYTDWESYTLHYWSSVTENLNTGYYWI